MTDLKAGARVEVTSGEFKGHKGTVVGVFTYSSGANTDYDVVLDNYTDPHETDGSVMIEDYELEAI